MGIRQIFQDDNKHSSWMRVAGTIIIFILMIGSVLLYRDWKMALLVELSKGEPNYDGLNSLFQSMMIGFVGGVFVTLVGKIIQKKYETGSDNKNQEG